MTYDYNKRLKSNSRELRKNMTKEEKKLWYEFLRECGMTFHRQKIIGNYIVDFYCAAAKIVIEIDGSQHYEDEHVSSDLQRDAYLNSLGIRVLRYSNREINEQFKNVCEDIYKNLQL